MNARKCICLLFTLAVLTASSSAQSFPGKLTSTETDSSQTVGGCTITTSSFSWQYTEPNGAVHSFLGVSKFIVELGSCKVVKSTTLNEWSSDGLYYLQATGASGSITSASGYLNPKYKIMHVTYAPPGGNSNSSVSYANTNFVGNTSTNNSSFNQTYAFSISVCSTIANDSCNPAGTGGGSGLFGVSDGVQITGTESNSWTLASNTSTTITTSKQTALTEITPGVPNVYSPFDHDYDLVWVWLNPVALFTIVPGACVNNTTTCLYWNGFAYDWNDPAHTIDVRPILVGYLNGDFKNPDGSPCYATDATCDPGDASALSRGWVTTQTFAPGEGSGITQADLANICKADPFCSNPSYLVTLKSGVTPPTTTDQRFTLSTGATQDFPYAQAGPDSTKGVTTIYNQQYTTTNSESQGGSYSYSQGVGMEEKFGGTFFGIGVQTDIKQTLTFMWTDTWQNTVTNTATQTDIATITGPPCPAIVLPCMPTYSEPGEFTVFQDNLYGTFMFWPNPYFSIGPVTPATQGVTQGGTASFTIPTTANAGYSGTIASFNITGLPSGTTAQFTPTTGAAGTTFTLNVNTTLSTPTGTYPLTISATDASLSYLAYATLVVSTSADFTIAATPSSRTVTAGAKATYTVSTTALNGFGGVVALNTTGLPTGATANFSPTSITSTGSSTLTIATTKTTTAGTYTLDIVGTSGSLTHSMTVTLVINAPVPGFSISASPSSQTVTAGGSTTYTATTKITNGFSGVVALSVSGLPSGASAGFNPTSISGAGTSTLTVNTAQTTASGTYALTITGTSGTLIHSTTVTLVVSGADFSLSSSPQSQGVKAGTNAIYTVSSTSLGGFSGTVTLSLSGLPSGASGSFQPASITGSGSSTLTIGTSPSTPLGNYTLSITGTSGALTHTVNVVLTVNATAALPMP